MAAGRAAKTNIGGWWSGLHATPQQTSTINENGTNNPEIIGQERQLPPGKDSINTTFNPNRQLPPGKNTTNPTNVSNSSPAPGTEAEIFAQQMKNGKVTQADIVEYLKNGNARSRYADLARQLHPDATGVKIDGEVFSQLVNAWRSVR